MLFYYLFIYLFVIVTQYRNEIVTLSVGSLLTKLKTSKVSFIYLFFKHTPNTAQNPVYIGGFVATTLTTKERICEEIGYALAQCNILVFAWCDGGESSKISSRDRWLLGTNP